MDLWDNVVTGVVVTTVSFVDMVSDRISQISQIYENSMNQTADDNSTGVDMPKAQFVFVEKLRKEDPQQFVQLVEACTAVEAMSTDAEKETYLKKLIADLLTTTTPAAAAAAGST